MMNSIKNIFQLCKEHALRENVCFINVFCDLLYARYIHGFSIEDYFYNTPGYAMKNYQRKDFFSNKRWIKVREIFNNKEKSKLLDNKIDALNLFSAFIYHDWLDPSHVAYEEFKEFVESHSKLLLKPVSAEGGYGISVYVPSNDLFEDYKKMHGGGYLLEECIKQNERMSFNNESVNTIRVYSVMDRHGNPHILKTCLRAGVGSSVVDNFHSGGVIYPINTESGFVELYGEQRLGQKKIFIHPGSDIMMLGFKIPNWSLLISTVKEMAKIIPQVRYVGWDMVITNDGVDFIEANDNADPALLGRFGVDRLFYKKIMQYR